MKNKRTLRHVYYLSGSKNFKKALCDNVLQTGLKRKTIFSLVYISKSEQEHNILSYEFYTKEKMLRRF